MVRSRTMEVSRIKLQSFQPNPGTCSAINFIGAWNNDMVALLTYMVTIFLLPAKRINLYMLLSL